MPTELNINTPDAVDEISPHLHRCWYASRRIVVYDIFDISRGIINDWAELALNTIQTWAAGQPYLALHNISYRGVAMKYSGLHLNIINPAITDEGRQRLSAILREKENFQGCIAPLVSIHFSGYFTRVLTDKALRNRPARNFQYKIFTEKEPALSWLATAITSV
ncbi:MAG: hypothetical protein ACLFVO_07390 [Chloroflexaceae bacterium]